jgi:hypothetical protein
MKNVLHKIISPTCIGRTKYAKLALITALGVAVSFTGIVYASEKPSG